MVKALRHPGAGMRCPVRRTLEHVKMTVPYKHTRKFDFDPGLPKNGYGKESNGANAVG
jgi:hypothetical protein